MSKNHHAWTGELVLLEAKWTDKDGHTVKFKLATPNEERPNPFKVFTKRKSGRAGTLFYASLAVVDGLKTDEGYSGNVMLAGWADTSTQGYTVTFWVEPPDTGLHPFQGYTRGVSSFMTGLVELDDDEQPIDQVKRAKVEGGSGAESGRRREAVNLEHDTAGSNPASPTTFPKCSCDDAMQMACSDTRSNALSPGVVCKRLDKATSLKRRGARQLSQYAAMLCQNTQFWDWINEVWLQPHSAAFPVENTEAAAAWMRARLNITSRRTIDGDEAVAEAYHEKIRKPFVEWSEAHENA